MRVEINSATATPATSASGYKYQLSRTPAGGNFTQGSVLSVGSGTESVTWSLEGSPGGNLTPSGATASYTAPTTLSSLLVATVKAVNGSGVAAYQPLWFNPPSGSGTVTISPSSPGSVAPYQTLNLTATVTGGTTNNVKWTVLSYTTTSTNGGSFSTLPSVCSASSTYRSPSTVAAAGNVTVQAESCDNPAWKATAVIPVSVGSSVMISTISPAPASVAGSQQYGATVSNADDATVQWSVSPAGTHTINSSGMYAANSFTGNATVTARSVENTSVSASHPFNVLPSGIYNATLVSFSVTPSLVQGQAFTGSVTMSNPVGGLTWDTTAGAGSNQVTLGSQSPANNTLWGVSSGTTGTASVSAGSSAVFSFSGRAPVTVTGQQVMDWQLKRGSGTWFGPIVRPSFTTVGVVAGTKQSVVVSQPSALSAQASQNFSVNVRFRNTGTAVWWGSAVNGSNAFQLRSRWRLAGSSGAWSSAVVPLPQNYLDPNGEVPFSFPQLAPSVPGSYDLRWQMEQNGGAAFGAEAASTLTVQSGLPGVFGMTPINGSAAEASFTAVYSGGSSALNIARFLVWNTPGYGNPNCVVEYTASTNQVRIGDWPGTMSSPITLGTNGMISNARCYLRAQDSSISSAQNGSNAVQLTLRVGFSSPMIGTWDVFAMAENTAAQSTGWVLQGQWSIPNVISVVVTPGSATLASGQSRSFTAVVSGTSNTGVGWSHTGWGSVSPPTGGTTTFTAGTVTSTQTSSVVATSLADTTKTGLSYLTIHSSPSVVSIVDFAPTQGSGIEGNFSIEASGGNAPVYSIQFYANTSMLQSGGCIVTVYPQSGTVSLALPGGTFVSGSFNSGWLYGQYCNVDTNFSWAPINPNNNSAIANIRVSFLPWTSHTGWLSLFAKTSNTAGASSLQWEYRGSWSKQ